MKDNFKELCSRIFYEEALTSPLCCKQKVEFKWIEAAEFYRRAVPIYDLAVESLSNPSFKQNFLSRVFNAFDFSQFTADEIFSSALPSIKEEINSHEDIPAYVLSFSFSKDSKKICTVFRYFKIHWTLESGTLEEKHKYEAKLFKESFENACGLFVDLGPFSLLLFNDDKKTMSTVNHELMHWFQLICKKYSKSSSEKFEGIPEKAIIQLNKKKDYETRETITER